MGTRDDADKVRAAEAKYNEAVRVVQKLLPTEAYAGPEIKKVSELLADANHHNDDSKSCREFIQAAFKEANDYCEYYYNVYGFKDKDPTAAAKAICSAARAYNRWQMLFVSVSR